MNIYVIGVLWPIVSVSVSCELISCFYYIFIAVKESSKREIDTDDSERKKLKKENSTESSTSVGSNASVETEKRPVRNFVLILHLDEAITH